MWKGGHPERIITRAYPTGLSLVGSRTVKKQNYCYLSHSSYGILLRHPELNKIYGDLKILKFLIRGHI